MPVTFEALESLERLANKTAKLRADLRRSLTLQEFFPDAFKHGACKSHVVGNPFTPWQARFVLELGNGARFEWPVQDVPLALWQRTFDTMRRDGNRDLRARRFYNQLEKGEGNA